MTECSEQLKGSLDDAFSSPAKREIHLLQRPAECPPRPLICTSEIIWYNLTFDTWSYPFFAPFSGRGSVVVRHTMCVSCVDPKTVAAVYLIDHWSSQNICSYQCFLCSSWSRKKKCCARIPVGSSGIAREPRDGEVSHFVNLLSVVRGLDHYVILIWASIFHRDSELLLLPGTATGSSLYKSCTNVTLGMWNWRNPRGCADWWFWLVWAVVAQVYELICTNFEGARSVCVPNLVSDGVSFDELLSYLREISGRFIDLIGFQVLRERDGTGQIYDTL